MKIGIVSDSHGKSERLNAAIIAMKRSQVEAIVHCGDISDPDDIDRLAETGVAVYVVAGNMDHRVSRLREVAEKRGVHFSSEVLEVPLGDGCHLVATHGHDQRVLGELIADQQFGYVCHGHTHCRRDERIDKTRVINPGALCHPKRPPVPSAAILDTGSDTLDWLEIDV